MSGRVPNVGSDPINPAYYAGTACAEIIEYMPANVALAAKYAWRLGEKDAEAQEAGKSIWYLEREIDRMVKANYPAVYDEYRQDCYYRIEAAMEAGKLTNKQMSILTNLVEFTINPREVPLGNAILIFRTYL